MTCTVTYLRYIPPSLKKNFVPKFRLKNYYTVYNKTLILTKNNNQKRFYNSYSLQGLNFYCFVL
jgi:hypothetical protein